MSDERASHLGSIETYLRTTNPDLHPLVLIGQAHYGSPGFAFIEVLGAGEDRARRRRIRADATHFLTRLGHRVELEGRDIFLIDPIRPRSRHEGLSMLAALKRKLGADEAS